MNVKPSDHWRVSIIAFVLGMVFMYWSSQHPSTVQADTRKASPPSADQHFKSGGRLAESVLQEILVVLKRIDERLARLETSHKPNSRGGLPQTPAVDSGESSSGSLLPEIKIRRGS